MSELLSKLESPIGIGLFFLLGLITSFHCVTMCGPISIIVMKSHQSSIKKFVLYHGSRVLSYTWLGWGLGVINHKITQSKLTLVWLSAWIVLLCIFALGKTSWLESWLSRTNQRLGMFLSKLSPLTKGMWLGFFSPLFPCGPLYAAFAASLLAPSPFESGLWMLCMSLGTIPLLLMQQVTLERIATTLGFKQKTFYFRWLALITALFLLGKIFLLF